MREGFERRDDGTGTYPDIIRTNIGFPVSLEFHLEAIERASAEAKLAVGAFVQEPRLFAGVRSLWENRIERGWFGRPINLWELFD
jgi:hypothetical protein